MNDISMTVTRAELCAMQCAISEAIAATLEAQMSADELGFRALGRHLDIYQALQRKLRRIEEAHTVRTDPRFYAYEATDRTAWVGELPQVAARAAQ